MKRKLPSVEFFILNTNAKDDVRGILKRLRNISYPKNLYRITVVDNNSVDGSKEMLASSFPWVRVIKLMKNHGMSGLNYGVKATRASLCFILDDDSYFEPSSVNRAILEFEHDPTLGILACNITNPFDRKTEYKYMPINASHSVNWCDFVGGGVVIRTAVFNSVGYFNLS